MRCVNARMTIFAALAKYGMAADVLMTATKHQDHNLHLCEKHEVASEADMRNPRRGSAGRNSKYL